MSRGTDPDRDDELSILRQHSVWTEIIADGPPKSLSDNRASGQPARRYGHAAAHWDEQDLMIVTHGYYYDVEAQRAEWLSDTWAFDVFGQWTMLHDQCQSSECPTARFGSVIVIHNDSLYLSQGDDGGQDQTVDSLHSASYKFSLLDDVWKLPLTWPIDKSVSRWVRVTQSTKSVYQSTIQLSASVSSPPARAHHAAVYSQIRSDSSDESFSMMLAFGGMIYNEADHAKGDRAITASNDLWRFDLADSSWTHITCSTPPPARFGHAMAMTQPSLRSVRLFVYGGFMRDQPDYADLWSVVLNNQLDCVWTELLPHSVKPVGRGYPSLVASTLGTHLLMFGGARCKLGCKCLDESWAFDLFANRWSQLAHSGRWKPLGRYKHTAVVRHPRGSSVTHMIMFGGESYVPQRYHSDVWEMQFDPTHILAAPSVIPAEYLDLIVLLGVVIGLIVFVFVGRRLKITKLKL